MKQSGRWVAVALAGLGLACGNGDGAPAHVGPKMAPTEAKAAAEREPGMNRPPQVDAVRFQPEQPTAGAPVRAVVEASDPDGDGIRLGFVWRVAGERVSGDDTQVTLAGARKGDAFSVRVTASDGVAESEPFQASSRVGNHPPVLRGIQIEPAGRITTGGPLGVRAEVEDPDGDPISFEHTWWVNGHLVDESGPVLSTRELRRGDSIRVRVRASDGEDTSQPIESPEIEVVNAAPVIRSEAGAAGADGTFRYLVRAEDPDGDRGLRFQLTQAPDGMTVDPGSGAIEWRPRSDQAGTHAVEIVVEDLQGGRAFQRFELTVGFGDDAPALPAAPAR